MIRMLLSFVAVMVCAACSARPDSVATRLRAALQKLRPEGKAGPLVRTLASHRGYY